MSKQIIVLSQDYQQPFPMPSNVEWCQGDEHDAIQAFLQQWRNGELTDTYAIMEAFISLLAKLKQLELFNRRCIFIWQDKGCLHSNKTYNLLASELNWPTYFSDDEEAFLALIKQYEK